MRVFSSEEELNEIKGQIKNQLKSMRTRSGLTQNDIEDKCSCCSARTYQKMETGNIGVRFESFLEVFRLFQGTDHDAAVLFGNHPSGSFLASDQDDSACHLARLNKFTHQKYTICYVDFMDKMIYLMKLIRQDPPQDSYYDGIVEAYRTLGMEDQIEKVLEPARRRSIEREKQI